MKYIKISLQICNMKEKLKSALKNKRGVFFYILTGLMITLGVLVVVVAFIVLLHKLHIINSSTPGFFVGSKGGLEENSLGPIAKMPARAQESREGTRMPSNNSLPRDRMFATDIYASIYVKDASKAADELVVYANGLGGFLVKQSINTYSNPYKYTSVSLTLRIPKASADKFIAHLKEVATEVKYLERYGTDITDQYEDISKKLEVYQETYQKIHDLMQKTDDVNTLLKLQDRLMSVQRQIDYYKGRRQSLEKEAKYVEVSLNITDKKYAVDIKQASRFKLGLEVKKALFALIRTLNWILELFIWVGVYSVIWAPIAYFILKARSKN